jgi:hypothetical protein
MPMRRPSIRMGMVDFSIKQALLPFGQVGEAVLTCKIATPRECTAVMELSAKDAEIKPLASTARQPIVRWLNDSIDA